MDNKITILLITLIVVGGSFLYYDTFFDDHCEETAMPGTTICPATKAMVEQRCERPDAKTSEWCD